MKEFKDLYPEGVADMHSEEFEFNEEVISYIKTIFKSFGYRQVLTPTVEYYDLYSGLEGVMDKDKMFKLIDNNGKILVLRPDATMPVARMAAANYNSNSGYLKFSYVTNIFRLKETQQGNKREIIQGGIEYLGNSKLECEGEVIAVGIKTLQECGIKDFHIDLGQVEYLNSLIKEIDLEESEKLQLHSLIETKNYGDLNEFINKLNISDELKNIFREVPKLYGKPEKVLKKARELVVNKEMESALDNLEYVYSLLEDYEFDKYIFFDLGFTNQFNYYTGIIFKGYIDNFGEVLLSGGRYDNLTKQFGSNIPACGFGLNIDKLVEVMKIRNIKKQIQCYTDYLVIYKEKFRKRALSLSQKLRDKGFIVEIDSYDENLECYLRKSSLRNIRKIIRIEQDILTVTDLYNNQITKCTEHQLINKLDSKGIIYSIH